MRRDGSAVEVAELMARARQGDGDAFGRLTEPYHRELLVHCYRLLGSFHDAENAVRESLLAAWQHLSGFEDRASLRTWLYRIATNKCLDARRSQRRRSAQPWNVPGVPSLEPTRLGEVVWLEPYPDALLAGAGEPSLGPEARYERKEAISLAFVTALQVLPPRQVAILVLRDVLGFRATEVADILDTTVSSVTSALKRARAGLQRGTRDRDRVQIAPAEASAVEQAILAKFVHAWEAADVDALVALLSDDVVISMPPMPFEYEGRDRVGEFIAALFGAGRRFDLVPTRANGHPAFGAYLRDQSGVSSGAGLFVLIPAHDRIRALVRFENTVLPTFALPPSISSGGDRSGGGRR